MVLAGVVSHVTSVAEDNRGLSPISLVNRSWQHSILGTLGSRNPALWWVAGGAFAFLLLALILPFLREAFHFGVVAPQHFALSVAAGLGSALWFELYKVANPR